MKKSYKIEVECANCEPAEVMPRVLAACRKIESDCNIEF